MTSCWHLDGGTRAQNVCLCVWGVSWHETDLLRFVASFIKATPNPPPCRCSSPPWPVPNQSLPVLLYPGFPAAAVVWDTAVLFAELGHCFGVSDFAGCFLRPWLQALSSLSHCVWQLHVLRVSESLSMWFPSPVHLPISHAFFPLRHSSSST